MIFEPENKKMLPSILLRSKNEYKAEEEIKHFKERFQSDNIDKKTINILIVDDNEINRIIAKELIEKNGWNCDVAENGKKAIHKLKNNKFDLIFMDISMPGMDGIETSKVIKKEERWNNIPIVIITAYNLAQKKKNVLETGVDDVLSKPIKEEELNYMVIKHLYGDRIHEQNYEYSKGIENLEKMLDGNKTITIKLAKKLVEQFSKDRMEEILSFCALKKLEELKNIIHKLKGAVLNFELMSIYNLLEELNSYVIKNNIQQIYITIDEICKKIRGFENYLSIYEKN